MGVELRMWSQRHLCCKIVRMYHQVHLTDSKVHLKDTIVSVKKSN